MAPPLAAPAKPCPPVLTLQCVLLPTFPPLRLMWRSTWHWGWSRWHPTHATSCSGAHLAWACWPAHKCCRMAARWVGPLLMATVHQRPPVHPAPPTCSAHAPHPHSQARRARRAGRAVALHVCSTGGLCWPLACCRLHAFLVGVFSVGRRTRAASGLFSSRLSLSHKSVALSCHVCRAGTLWPS